MQAAGQVVPAQVLGWGLVDTGASSTCIGLSTARALRLKQTGVGQTRGAGGLHQNPRFFARIQIGPLAFHDGNGTTGLMLQTEVTAIPGLEDDLESLQAIAPGVPADEVKLIALLGRDFLQHCRMVYDGANGAVNITIVRPA